MSSELTTGTVGRPTKGPRKDIHVRVPEPMLIELFVHYPNMLAPTGGVRYGAIQDYLLNLMRQDLEQRRKAVKRATP